MSRIPDPLPQLTVKAIVLGVVLSAVLAGANAYRSEEHTSELQSRPHLVCRLLLEKKKKHTLHYDHGAPNRRHGHDLHAVLLGAPPSVCAPPIPRPVHTLPHLCVSSVVPPASSSAC